MQVGDIVKSFDFVGIDNCYMIGKVMSISKMDGTFRATFIKRVFNGSEDRKFKTDTFVAPLPDNHYMDRVDFPRVVVIA